MNAEYASAVALVGHVLFILKKVLMDSKCIANESNLRIQEWDSFVQQMNKCLSKATVSVSFLVSPSSGSV